MDNLQNVLADFFCCSHLQNYSVSLLAELHRQDTHGYIDVLEGIEVDESLLTGESDNIFKTINDESRSAQAVYVFQKALD